MQAYSAYDLVCLHDRLTKQQFGGPPHSENVDRVVQNMVHYRHYGLPARTRVCLGEYFYEQDGSVLGYAETTVLRGAQPTQYDKQYPQLHGPQTYVQLKKLIVHPRALGTGVASALLIQSMALSGELHIPYVVDVRADNARMLRFLEKHGIEPQHTWHTPSRSAMVRLGAQP